ncbi:hypothetical protein [Halalkalibacter okhensis]|uniref:Uncharacterized protein n=1 Tax=Halalkalibacter okhensis TaxID=333138 RepID=A0A0B0I7M6_9BACI|nr:hypothetical protein [Halalkalibacter okhensis]KHF38443.1 hypothetical protein LQ50_21135 [Halalkalibacter okhensis]
MVPLSKNEIEILMSTLNKEQIYFLQHRTKQKKKSRWLQTLANDKGIDLNEKMSDQEMEEKLDDWILVEIKDGGYQKRPHKCDCGQALRFQYIIRNKAQGAVRYLGENCFENYLSLPASVIKDVKKGLYSIDLERDEILMKYKKNLFYPLDKYMHLPLPQDLLDQYERGLPLSDNQINLVERIHTRYEEERKLASLFQRLTIEQQQFVSKQNQEDRRELLLSIEEGHAESFLDIEDLSEFNETLLKQLHLNLPLLERQKQMIEEWQRTKKREKALYALTLEQQQFILTLSKEKQAALLDQIHKPLYFIYEEIKNLPLDDQIKKQVDLKLPLLKEQIYQIHLAQNKGECVTKRNAETKIAID